MYYRIVHKPKRLILLVSLILFSLYSLRTDTHVETNSQNIPELQHVESVDTYTVTKVVDGDTVDVSAGTSTMRIRLVGINAPESVDPRRKVECYGVESSHILSEYLSNKQVYIVRDSRSGDKDIYNRDLAYIKLPDSTDVGEYMISIGAAREYTYKGRAYDTQNTYKQLEFTAKDKHLGLWNKEICTQ